MNKLDLSGQIFGSLTVTGRHGEVAASKWECRCVCGRMVVCTTGNLRTKSGKRCSCSQRDAQAERMTKHGLAKTAEHRSWSEMMTRCTNPKSKSFARYGARGITIAAEWRSFEQFLADMGPMPAPGYTIERIDNNGAYCPGNCRWATMAEQAMNKSNSRALTFNGETHVIAEWARRTGISEDTIERRLNLLGWDTEKALSTPVREWGPGRPKSLSE